MTPNEMRAGLLKAFELLTFGSPDRELHDKVGITKWIEDCDAWLDKFAPSKVGADEPNGEPMACENCGSMSNNIHRSCCPERKMIPARELIKYLWNRVYNEENDPGIV